MGFDSRINRSQFSHFVEWQNELKKGIEVVKVGEEEKKNDKNFCRFEREKLSFYFVFFFLLFFSRRIFAYRERKIASGEGEIDKNRTERAKMYTEIMHTVHIFLGW